MDATTCPECGAPAEITDRWPLESTDGPIEHVRVVCVRRHWFLMSTESLARGRRMPAPRPTAHRSGPVPGSASSAKPSASSQP